MEADFYMTPDRPREDKQSRPPERLQRLRSCSKNEPATSIVLKASAVAVRMTTTEKTEARPYCNGSSPFAVNSKEDEGFRGVGFRGVGQGAEVIKVFKVLPGARSPRGRRRRGPQGGNVTLSLRET